MDTSGEYFCVVFIDIQNKSKLTMEKLLMTFNL